MIHAADKNFQEKVWVFEHWLRFVLFLLLILIAISSLIEQHMKVTGSFELTHRRVVRVSESTIWKFSVIKTREICFVSQSAYRLTNLQSMIPHLREPNLFCFSTSHLTTLFMEFEALKAGVIDVFLSSNEKSHRVRVLALP